MIVEKNQVYLYTYDSYDGGGGEMKIFFFQNILNVMAALLEFVMFTYRNFLYLYSNITNEEVQTELKSGK